MNEVQKTFRFKRSLKPISYYLKIMNESHKKVIVPKLRSLYKELKDQKPDLSSLENPTMADLDKIFLALGRATYRENLVCKINDMISHNYGRYPCIGDPVFELVELRENCQRVIFLLNQMVTAILQNNRKKEVSNA